MDSFESSPFPDDTSSLKPGSQGFARSHAVAIAATSASVFSVLFGYPTRMQAFKYGSMKNCITNTYANEGILGFYRGVFPALASVSLLRSISFSLYTRGKQDIMSRLDTSWNLFTRIAMAASCSGLLTGSVIAVINAPVELIKIQKQLERLNVISIIPHHEQPFEEHRKNPFINSNTHSTRPPSSEHNTSAMGWVRKIIQKKGILGLYSGAHLHIARDGLGTCLYFAGYELMKFSLTPDHGVSSPLVHLLSGGFAGTACWLVLFPIDVVKSVIQRDVMKDVPKYHTAREFIQKAWKRGGILRFYSGIGPQLVRSFPVHALNFLVYEQVYKYCSQSQDSL